MVILRAFSTISRVFMYRTEIQGRHIWCFSERTPIPLKELNALGLIIRFKEGMPSVFDKAQGDPSLFILDDLLNYVYSRQMCDPFTKGSHH